MSYHIVYAGTSRSFPSAHAFTSAAQESGPSLVYIGEGSGAAFAVATRNEDAPFIAIELGSECLGVHTGEDRGLEGSNVVGFARFRLGTAAPSSLVELVRQPHTHPAALLAARAAFEAAGFKVAVCADFPGRIVDRLVRPYYNAALRRLDEGLASAQDMDTTLRLGLGYPEGPITLLERTGLAEHHDITLSLFEQLREEAYAPARRALVAALRRQIASSTTKETS
ncbi:3-hydroxyacyl-CoA dehydrogenase family protein [Variovorax ginsengisoli]|uniref:3-hydroxyacyl-CoA dehydrogenase family protein n=1 Tax=Variovorax ginsengisoli TaxID=363844 RepID=A0ABT8SGP0_9BURK|nr:3-hydroxyacyl-CoA dehydrogenase family protein [Variovorax ginsengisoli]MDN8618192.1 3-hydroxyacyl-CoA dehydrogenase family protein [Variovorax ginsengisoli]MDO1537362.1 3-hydroxyacyl-CoA dehydrogenase family protein [Variovorax ginsengisoli]